MLIKKQKNKLNHIYYNILYTNLFTNLYNRKNNKITKNKQKIS